MQVKTGLKLTLNGGIAQLLRAPPQHNSSMDVTCKVVYYRPCTGRWMLLRYLQIAETRSKRRDLRGWPEHKLHYSSGTVWLQDKQSKLWNIKAWVRGA